MTAQSPRVRIYVTGILSAASDPIVDVAMALGALRSGEIKRAVVSGGSGTESCLVLWAGRAAGAALLAEMRGFATVDERRPPGDGDDLQPARAVRRALADGRMSAADIGYACAFEVGAEYQSRALAALERGLGRFAAATELETGPDPLVRCAVAVGRSDGSVGGAIALVINPGVGSIALAFGRP